MAASSIRGPKLYSPRSVASPGFKFTCFKFARAVARARLSSVRPGLAAFTGLVDSPCGLEARPQ